MVVPFRGLDLATPTVHQRVEDRVLVQELVLVIGVGAVRDKSLSNEVVDDVDGDVSDIIHGQSRRDRVVGFVFHRERG